MLKSAGLFIGVDVKKIKFKKPAISVNEQISLLKSRGLNILDEDLAFKILSNITYYRLSAYMKFYQHNEKFITGTMFDDIVDLYNFDNELKTLIFENIRLVEIALRTKICLHMCTNYGSHWFYDKNNFKSEKENFRNLRK